MKVTLFLVIATAVLQLACSMPSAQGESTSVAANRRGPYEHWSQLLAPKQFVKHAKKTISEVGVFFKNAWEAFKEKLIEIGKGIKDFFVDVYNKFKDGKILEAFKAIWNGIKSAVNFLLNPMDIVVDIAITAFFKTVSPNLAQLYKEEDNGDDAVAEVEQKSEQVMADGTHELTSYNITMQKEFEEAKKANKPKALDCFKKYGANIVSYATEDISQLKGCTVGPYLIIKETIKMVKQIIKNIKTLYNNVKSQYKLCTFAPGIVMKGVCYVAILSANIPPVVDLIKKAITDVPGLIAKWKKQFEVLQNCTPSWVIRVKDKWTKVLGAFRNCFGN